MALLKKCPETTVNVQILCGYCLLSSVISFPVPFYSPASIFMLLFQPESLNSAPLFGIMFTVNTKVKISSSLPLPLKELNSNVSLFGYIWSKGSCPNGWIWQLPWSVRSQTPQPSMDQWCCSRLQQIPTLLTLICALSPGVWSILTSKNYPQSEERYCTSSWQVCACSTILGPLEHLNRAGRTR